MLKLKIAGEPNDLVVELRLTTDGSAVVVEDANSGYNIVGFKIVDNKVNLIRYGSISDKNYNLDEEHAIEVLPDLY